MVRPKKGRSLAYKKGGQTVDAAILRMVTGKLYLVTQRKKHTHYSVFWLTGTTFYLHMSFYGEAGNTWHEQYEGTPNTNVNTPTCSHTVQYCISL